MGHTNLNTIILTQVLHNKLLTIGRPTVLGDKTSQTTVNRSGQTHELQQEPRQQRRKHKAMDTKPLAEPLADWSELSIQEKHDLAAEMIEVIYISHLSEDIEIKMGI